jgi:type I restriction enzyme S subunit
MAAVVSTPWFRRQLEIATHGVGGRRERVRPEKFLKLTIPMPTIEKQMQAVEVFRRLTAIEPKQAQTAAELDALLPSILDRAFRGEL